MPFYVVIKFFLKWSIKTIWNNFIQIYKQEEQKYNCSLIVLFVHKNSKKIILIYSPVDCRRIKQKNVGAIDNFKKEDFLLANSGRCSKEYNYTHDLLSHIYFIGN